MTLELGLYLCCHCLALVTSDCLFFFAPELNARCGTDKPVWGVFRAALSRFRRSLSKLPFFLLQRPLPPSSLGTGAWPLVLFVDNVVSSGILQPTESIENEGPAKHSPLWEGLGREEHASQLCSGHFYLAITPHEPLALSKSIHFDFKGALGKVLVPADPWPSFLKCIKMEGQWLLLQRRGPFHFFLLAVSLGNTAHGSPKPSPTSSVRRG